MGTVYLARHAGEAGFQRLFAVKVLHAHLAEEAGFVDMLRDEARIAARIHHPNVVAVVDIGTQGDSHYIVMEYVEGPSFATLWKRSRDNRPIDLVLSVMIETLEGLHAAHTLQDEEGEPLQLVHRDVSPQNVLVGVDGVARITDFGIAKAESRIGSTQPGMRKGKLQFMSPEQIKDAEKIDLRTDIWACGVVLYGLLTGEHLFRDENDAATVHNVIAKEITPPSSRPAKPPEVFDAIILKALERDPAKRYDSALDMADALRKAAIEANLVASRQDVARWVTSTFGAELESRRVAIRDVTRRRSAPSEYREYSQVTVLPSLPSTLNNPIPDGRHTPSSIKQATFDGIASDRQIISVPPPELEMLPDEPDQEAARRKRIAVGLAAGVLLFLLAGFLIRLTTNSPPAEAAAPKVEKQALAAAAPPTAEVSAAPVANAAAVSATAAPDESAEPAKSSDSDKKSGHFRPRVVARPAGTRPEPVAHEATARPEAESAEPAAPRPTAAPQADFEKNPYLRR
jgi:serine/threonine-protein kinase